MRTPAERKARLLPDGKPRWIRVYDHPDFIDRYTVVFTGNYQRRLWVDGKLDDENGLPRPETYLYIGMNAFPYSPWGVGYHGSSLQPIDRTGYRHLGKKISFDDLPADCQRFVLDEYIELWGLREIDYAEEPVEDTQGGKA